MFHVIIFHGLFLYSILHPIVLSCLSFFTNSCGNQVTEMSVGDSVYVFAYLGKRQRYNTKQMRDSMEAEKTVDVGFFLKSRGRDWKKRDREAVGGQRWAMSFPAGIGLGAHI